MHIRLDGAAVNIECVIQILCFRNSLLLILINGEKTSYDRFIKKKMKRCIFIVGVDKITFKLKNGLPIFLPT